MPQQTHFINEPPINYQLKNKTILRKWVVNTIQNERKQLIQLNFIFCNDEYLLGLNQKYLNHNYYTDILTFDNSDKKIEIEGDIFISLNRVRENAKINKTNLLNELARVMIHGVLHLCGHKDKSTSQQKNMRAKEDFYLKKLAKG